MITINSDKIDKKNLDKEIQNSIERYEINRKNKIFPQNKEIKQKYTIEHFAKYEDKNFIENVYRVLLKKEVDDASLEFYLNALRAGKLTKTEIICMVRFSKEGRKYNVEILGIKKRFVITYLYSLPVVGYFFKFLINLLLFPKLVEKVNHQKSVYLLQSELFDSKLIDIKREIKKVYEDIEDQNILINKMQMQIDHQNRETEIIKNYTGDINTNIRLNLQKIQSLLVAKDINTHKISSVVKNNMNILDPFYVAFENKFRGSRDEIKERNQYYLPMIQKVISSKDDMVIDIGCGRGEWLELLREHNIDAKGIDLNQVMVEESLSYGLDVVNADVIEYLKKLESKSIKIVTAFHVVEHISFEQLIEFFDESFRVLKKGGMILFETPNPENIIVGSCSFYTDPTHQSPIPPVTLKFIASNRGFADVKIHRLHPVKNAEFLKGKHTEDINNLIYSSTKEQDYSVTGYKI